LSTGQATSAVTALLAQQQGMLPADLSNVSGVAFSPGDRLLASAGGDGTADPQVASRYLPSA
jgi:hypothetical protein